MEAKDCCVGIEITSESVKLIAGFVLNNDSVYVLDHIEHKCDALSGALKGDEEVIKAIKSVVSQATKNLNFPIKDISLLLPSFDMLCKTDTGMTATCNANNYIHNIDIQNIVSQIKKRNFTGADVRIVDVVPDMYYLDNNEQCLNPIGKASKELKLHAAIYAMNEKVISQFEYCILKAGFNVKNMCIAPYASCLYFAGMQNLPESYILLDIGSKITTISQVHLGKTVVNSSPIKFGGDYITNFIADRLQISVQDAEYLKTTYGMDNDTKSTIAVFNGITLKDLALVIRESLNEGSKLIKKVIDEFQELDNQKLPVIITGGTANLYNIEEYMEEALNTTVVIYKVNNIGARDKSLVSLLGLIKYDDSQVKEDEDSQMTTTTLSRGEVKKPSRFNVDEDL